MATATIRDYTVYVLEGGTSATINQVSDTTLTEYGELPTVDEINEATGESVTKLWCAGTFENCTNLTLSQSLPDTVYGAPLMFGESGLILPPRFTRDSYSSLYRTFYKCTNLVYAPVIPPTDNIQQTFQGAGIVNAPSIPSEVTTMTYTFYSATNMTGEMVIRPTSISSYTRAFEGTTENIVLYGDQAVCEALAATATNGNVTWSAWYDPITPVTNRGEGSRTTATDIERMVKNGVLAVSTYAPARMNFTNTDIVHEDEWEALCDAAKTIDNTITYSTHYTNLNKIESAFDSAL